MYVFKRSVVLRQGMLGFYLCMAGDSFVWGIGLGGLGVELSQG